MAELVDSIAKSRYLFLRKREVSKLEASKLALENATEFLKPIMLQVDPYHLQKARRELRIGNWYAIDMLLSRMMKGNLEKAQETARCLVHDFPAHEYSIYANDAEFMLNLTIKRIIDLTIWRTLDHKYNKVSKMKYYVEYGIIETNASEPQKKSK